MMFDNFQKVRPELFRKDKQKPKHSFKKRGETNAIHGILELCSKW